MASTVAVIKAAMRMDAAQWNRTIDAAKQKFSDFVSDSTKVTAGTGALLATASVSLFKLSQSLAQAGSNATDLRKRLSATFSDTTDLDRVAEKVREIGASGPVSQDQAEKLSKQLSTFGEDVKTIEKDLERVGNVASKTGGSFESLGEAFATFGVKAEASNRLLEIANISPQRLAEFGAVLDKTGKAVDFTGQNATKAKEALRALVDQDFAGAMDQATTATEKLQGELKLLAEDAGKGLAASFELVAEQIAPALGRFRKFAEIAAPAVGIATAIGAAITGIGAASAGIVLVNAKMATLGITTTGVKGAMDAAALAATRLRTAGLTPLLASTLKMTAAAAGLAAAGAIVIGLFVATTKAINDQTKAQEALLKIENERAKNQREATQLLGKTTEELKAQGKTADDVAKGILALQERIQQAAAVGNEDLVKRLKIEVGRLQAAKRELAEGEAQIRREAQAQAEFDKPENKRKREAARKEALDAELGGIALRLAKEEITVKQSLELRKRALEQFKADEDQKRALAIETAKTLKSLDEQEESDNKTKSEEKRKERFDAELNRIEILRIENKITADREVELLNKVLKEFNLTEQEKRGLRKKSAEIRKQIRDKEAAEDKKAADEKEREDKRKAKEQEAAAKKAASDLARAREQGRDLKSTDLGSEVDRLQDQTEARGTNNTEAIKKAITDRLRLSIDSLRVEAEAQIKATESAEARAQIERNLQAQIRQEVYKTRDEYKAALDEQARALEEFRKKERGESTFGQVFGIEELGNRLKAEQATSLNKASPVNTGFDNTLPEILGRINAGPLPAPTAIGRGIQQGSAKIDGSIEVSVTVDGDGKPTVKTTRFTGLNSKFSEIEKSGRHMKGRISGA